jgi:hypothetical protein
LFEAVITTESVSPEPSTDPAVGNLTASVACNHAKVLGANWLSSIVTAERTTRGALGVSASGVMTRFRVVVEGVPTAPFVGSKEVALIVIVEPAEVGEL